MPEETDSGLITNFRRRLDFRFNNDRVVKKHRRNIYRYYQQINVLWKMITAEHQLIRHRHRVLATDVSKQVARQLAALRPNANQVYPKKVFRSSPPP